MRIVFDTNVLIAALITADGVCGALVKRCAQVHTPIVSEFILDELHEKLIGKFKKQQTDVDEAIDLLRESFVIAKPVALTKSVCRDPDDDTVLGTALAGQADCIVTGDKDLLTLGRFEGIDILQPSNFDEYEQAQVHSKAT